MHSRTISGFIIMLAIGWSLLQAQTLNADQIKEIREKLKSQPDEFVLPTDVVVIETDLGKICIVLDFNFAPLHAMNFKKLVNAGYFEGTTFHRVIPGFIIQGGDILSRDDNPRNDGTGDPGYTIPGEFGRKHIKGAVAAARMPDQVNPGRESNGSQFYICLEAQPMLDRLGYSVFGKVLSGMEVAEKIARQNTDRMDRPLQNVIMKKVYISTREEQNLPPLSE